MKIRKSTPSTELMLLKKVFYRPAHFYHPRLIDQIQTQTVLTYNFFFKKKNTHSKILLIASDVIDGYLVFTKTF